MIVTEQRTTIVLMIESLIIYSEAQTCKLVESAKQ